MHQFEIILALLVAVVLLGIAARRLGVPSPVLLVIGGLVIALLPGLPPVEFEPRLIFVVFIPPLLYRAALTASWRDLRANLRPITLLAVGLVVFTTIVVGVAAHALAPGLPWAAAFALGALVSPPDAPAATAFLRGLVVPRRVGTILEGESLVNDAAAIVAYRMAVAAAVSGTFSVATAGPRFVWVGTAGIAAGLAVSVATIAARVVWVFAASYGPRWLSRRLRERDRLGSWRHVALVAWAGLRGADSLVLALALPFTTAAGAPFPGRDLIIFLTYIVILMTLLVQGFSLQPFVNWLGICDTGETQRLEEAHAREQASAAALRRLDELAPGLDGETLTELRARYGHRRRRFGARVRAERDGAEEGLARGRRTAVLELLEAERRAVSSLRDKGMIGDHVMRRVQRDLDLEALLLGSR